MRNTFPCAINTLCMCTNAGNGTHSYKISCHDVWFYKFTGKLFSDLYLLLLLLIIHIDINRFTQPKNVKRANMNFYVIVVKSTRLRKKVGIPMKA